MPELTAKERREKLLAWMRHRAFPRWGAEVEWIYRYGGIHWNQPVLGPAYKDQAQARRDLLTLEREGLVRRLPGRPARWEAVDGR